MPFERKLRQPGLATDRPEFVGRHQLVTGVERPQIHLDLVGTAPENGRTATGAEEPPGIVACLAVDRYRILRKYCRGVKKGSMMLAAVETVAEADPIRSPRCHKSDIAAQAAARESVQNRASSRSSGGNVYNEQCGHCKLLAAAERFSAAEFSLSTQPDGCPYGRAGACAACAHRSGLRRASWLPWHNRALRREMRLPHA